MTAFGVSCALAGPLGTNQLPEVYEILSRLPQVFLWLWMNCFLFGLANQRLPGSILEDKINKPWRALPAGRITPENTRRFLLATIPLVMLASLYLGGTVETLGHAILTWMYNDLGGSDDFYVVRNSINGLGFICYGAGSAKVAAGRENLTPQEYLWAGIVGAIILSTLSMQDLPDVEGDAAKGRLTSPLVNGEAFCCWEIAIPILLWSTICPMFWHAGWNGYIAPITIGYYLAFRILRYRTVDAHKVSWKIWCLWTGSLYILPLFAQI